MAASDSAILLATARWCDKQYYLHELLKEDQLPTLVRCVKGQYANIGVASLSNSSASPTALVTSVGSCRRIAAQCVKFKDNQRSVNIGPKLAIPDMFTGYFEILSEDGKSVKCIESVAELARRLPDSCLVRDNLKGYLQQCSAGGGDAGDVTAAVTTVSDKWRTVTAGEILVLAGEVNSSSATAASHVAPRGRFLRCFDERGDVVLLSFESRGKFNAVAKEDNISGVHNMRNLLNKRLPLMVRMVSGAAPAGLKLGSQFAYEMRLIASFEEELVVALPLTKTDQTPTILPLSASLKLQLPAGGAVQQTKEFLRLHDRCLHAYHERVQNQIQVYDAHLSKNLRFDGQNWKIPVPALPIAASNVPVRRSGGGGDATPMAAAPTKIAQANTVVDAKNNDNDRASANGNALSTPPVANSSTSEYDEIDQIYDYIRGFAPLPKHLKSSSYDGAGARDAGHTRNVDCNRNLYANHRMAAQQSKRCQQLTTTTGGGNQENDVGGVGGGKRPTPPPLETIPSRKLLAAMKSSSDAPGAGRPILRSSVSVQDSSLPWQPAAKPRMFRQKSAMPTTAASPTAAAAAAAAARKNHHTTNIINHSGANDSLTSLTPSPLFHIRYKSLTNLLAAADSDTLGSSQSGGRCSGGGSAGSAAVRVSSNKLANMNSSSAAVAAAAKAGPRCEQLQQHQLHRPRSLTDLLWSAARGPKNSAGGPKIQLHPTVVADVIPTACNQRTAGGAFKLNAKRNDQCANSSKQDKMIRRRNSANLLNSAVAAVNSSKKHTIFYHL